MKTQFASVVAFLSVAGLCMPATAGQMMHSSSQMMIHTEGSELLEVDIIPCAAPGTPGSCGSNPAATQPLLAGKVLVLEARLFGPATANQGGLVVVDLDGAAPNTTYYVFIGNWVNNGAFQSEYAGPCLSGSIGAVRTGMSGFYFGFVFTDSTCSVPAHEAFVIPSGTVIGQPNFAFSPSDPTATQFTTGFKTR